MLYESYTKNSLLMFYKLSSNNLCYKLTETLQPVKSIFSGQNVISSHERKVRTWQRTLCMLLNWDIVKAKGMWLLFEFIFLLEPIKFYAMYPPSVDHGPNVYVNDVNAPKLWVTIGQPRGSVYYWAIKQTFFCSHPLVLILDTYTDN